MSAWRGRGPELDIDEGDEVARSSDKSSDNDDGDDDDDDSDSSDEDLSQKFPHQALPKHGHGTYVDKAFSETSSHSSRDARKAQHVGPNSGSEFGPGGSHLPRGPDDDDDDDDDDDSDPNSEGSFSGDESYGSDSQSATSSLTEGTGFTSNRSSGRGVSVRRTFSG
jgi:hypothetical protein